MTRCCNGCGRDLGDATEAELDCAVAGLPLPDVREECGCIRPTPTGMWTATCPHCPWLGGYQTRPAAEHAQQTHINQHRRTQP